MKIADPPVDPKYCNEIKLSLNYSVTRLDSVAMVQSSTQFQRLAHAFSEHVWYIYISERRNFVFHIPFNAPTVSVWGFSINC